MRGTAWRLYLGIGALATAQGLFPALGRLLAADRQPGRDHGRFQVDTRPGAGVVLRASFAHTSSAT